MAILHLHSSWGPNAELYRKLLSSQNEVISNYLVKRTNLFGHIPSSFYGCLVYMYIYEPHSCGTTESISRHKTPPPELELQRIVSHHMGAGSQTQVPCKNAVLNC